LFVAYYFLPLFLSPSISPPRSHGKRQSSGGLISDVIKVIEVSGASIAKTIENCTG